MEDYELTETAKLRSYKNICAKLGLIMCVYYSSRILNTLITSLISTLTDRLSSAAQYAVHAAISITLSYAVPILAAVIILNSFENYGGKLRELYKKPKRLARALGNFPAMYGLGYGIALLTLLSSLLLSKISGGQPLIEEFFRPTTLEPSTNIFSTLTMVFILVVIAPVCEEFLVRGIIFEALKPFGCGMAIILSSVLFGLMHGNMYMLFYTIALGFALGYIRYATGSLFVVTTLHAIINSVAAVMLLMLSLSKITNEENRLVNTLSNVYIMAMFILIIVGVIAFIRKIPVIRKYKIANDWTAVGAGRKTALFFLSVPVLIMLVLAFNEHTKQLLLGLLIY